MTDHAEEKREKVHPSDIEAANARIGRIPPVKNTAQRFHWDRRQEDFLAGVAHARKDQEHLIREARAKECEDMAKEATEYTLEAGSLSYRASMIREGKV